MISKVHFHSVVQEDLMKEYGLGPNNTILNSLKGEEFIIRTEPTL